jgi:tyrosinase
MTLPDPPFQNTITSDKQHRHTLSNTEKLDYIDAELCLMKAPAKLGLPGARTRFDEFQAIHQLQAYATHHVVCLNPIPSTLITGHL